MKQYLTGFFSAFCISISLFLFLDKDIKASNDTKTDKIIIEGPNGTTIIRGGTIELFNAKNQEILSLGYNRKMDGQINIKNNMGYNIVNIGAHHGDGFGGNGVVSINNEHGEYGWSVIGKVSPDHYK